MRSLTNGLGLGSGPRTKLKALPSLEARNRKSRIQQWRLRKTK